MQKVKNIGLKRIFKISGWLLSGVIGLWLTSVITSCGKSNITSAVNLNIKYEVLNLSPDLGPVNLYINFLTVNTTPFAFPVNQGYFFITALDTPFLIRTALVAGGPVLLSRSDTLKANLAYSLFIVGDKAGNPLQSIFTIDTASVPAVSRGKLRFVNASPSGATGFDIYANGSKIFDNIKYPSVSKYLEIPNGNYDLEIRPTGSSSIIKTMSATTIQDGRLYTLYTYGYTTRIDSAAFNAAIITNR